MNVDHQGYIFVHRRFRDDWKWQIPYRNGWSWMMLEATPVDRNGLKRGQILMTLRQWMRESGMKRSAAYRYLQRMKYGRPELRQDPDIKIEVVDIRSIGTVFGTDGGTDIGTDAGTDNGTKHRYTRMLITLLDYDEYQPNLGVPGCDRGTDTGMDSGPDSGPEGDRSDGTFLKNSTKEVQDISTVPPDPLEGESVVDASQSKPKRKRTILPPACKNGEELATILDGLQSTELPKLRETFEPQGLDVDAWWKNLRRYVLGGSPKKPGVMNPSNWRDWRAALRISCENAVQSGWYQRKAPPTDNGDEHPFAWRGENANS